RHGDTALAGDAPAGRYVEIARGRVELPTADTRGRGDGFQLGTDCSCGDAGDRRFGVEEGRYLLAQGGGGDEKFAVGRERHARPVLPQGVTIFQYIEWAMQDGNDVIEEGRQGFHTALIGEILQSIAR